MVMKSFKMFNLQHSGPGLKFFNHFDKHKFYHSPPLFSRAFCKIPKEIGRTGGRQEARATSARVWPWAVQSASRTGAMGTARYMLLP